MKTLRSSGRKPFAILGRSFSRARPFGYCSPSEWCKPAEQRGSLRRWGRNVLSVVRAAFAWFTIVPLAGFFFALIFFLPGFVIMRSNCAQGCLVARWRGGARSDHRMSGHGQPISLFGRC
jgi:hypothetical protein